jgi:hypothetical protein
MTEITKPETPKPETLEDLKPAKDPKGGSLKSMADSKGETQKALARFS